jgi:hypothetical protein
MDTNLHSNGRTSSEESRGDASHVPTERTPEKREQGISNRPDDEADAMPDGDETDDDRRGRGR